MRKGKRLETSRLAYLMLFPRNRQPWFSTLESYSPAVHRVKQAMFHCAIVNDVASNPLPPPHPELLKFFDAPKRAVKRAREPLEDCKSVFKVKEGNETIWVIILSLIGFGRPIVIKRVGMARKEGHAHAQDEDETLLLLDRKATVERVPTRTESKLNITNTPRSSPGKGKQKAPARNKDDSDTEEDENDDELLLDLKMPGRTPVPSGEERPLPTPARSPSPPNIDPGRAPGRIIGNTYPLKDFKKNIAQGDVVTKAVQDLAEVVVEVVLKPFATRRQGEMIECMTILRKTCLEVWVTFIVQLLVAEIAGFRRMKLILGIRSYVI
jgi:ATP-dependent DNA helicase 2 subunit 2